MISVGKILLLSNGNKFQRIVVHPETKTVADVTELTNLHPRLIDTVNLIPMGDCAISIFDHIDTQEKCQYEVIKTSEEEMIPLYQDLFVIFRNNDLDTSIECNEVVMISTMPSNSCKHFNLFYYN